jgi:hypothetical protein
MPKPPPAPGQVWRSNLDGLLYAVVAINDDGIWCKRARGYSPATRFGNSTLVHANHFEYWDLVTA